MKPGWLRRIFSRNSGDGSEHFRAGRPGEDCNFVIDRSTDDASVFTTLDWSGTGVLIVGADGSLNVDRVDTMDRVVGGSGPEEVQELTDSSAKTRGPHSGRAATMFHEGS